MKLAFISGITGQDGALLSKLLIDNNYKVVGGRRDHDPDKLWRLDYLGIKNQIEYADFSLLDENSISDSIQKYSPDEFYNLAAQSSVAESFKSPVETSLNVGISVTKILESIKEFSPKTKFFQACSAEIFGDFSGETVNEDTSIQPNNPYGVSKSYAYWMVHTYRKCFGIYAVNGILFSHESEFRGSEFFTKKIIKHVTNLKFGKQEVLEVGNIENYRDWSYAGDFVLGMYLSMQNQKPDDYIFSSGVKVKVKDFIHHSFELIGIELIWKGSGVDLQAFDSKTGDLRVKINTKFFRPTEISSFSGDSTKAKKILNWTAKYNYKEIAKKMLEFEISLYEKN
jgi:GDPmannose 4,6-dehydratase